MIHTARLKPVTLSRMDIMKCIFDCISCYAAAGEVQGESKQQPSPSARSDISQVCCTCGLESDTQDVHMSHKKLHKVVQTELLQSDPELAAPVTSKVQHRTGAAKAKICRSRAKKLESDGNGSKHRNIKDVCDPQISPTWDSRQFQHAVKDLGSLQQKLMEEAKQSRANIQCIRGAKNKHRAEHVTSKTFKSLPRNPVISHNNMSSGSIRDVQTESSLFPGSFDEQAELSLAERLEKQIQITEGLCQVIQFKD